MWNVCPTGAKALDEGEMGCFVPGYFVGIGVKFRGPVTRH